MSQLDIDGQEQPVRVCGCGCGASLAGRPERNRYAGYECKQRGAQQRHNLLELATPDHEAYRVIIKDDLCAYCGRRYDHWRPRMGTDHIVPMAAGGELEWDNLTACCQFCNSSKCDAPMLLFLLRGAVAA